MKKFKEYLVRDLTGRGATATHRYGDVRRIFGSEEDHGGETLRSWIVDAEVGDVFNSTTLTITRIQ